APSGELASLPRAPRDADLPLSFAQQRLWFLDLLEPGGAHYNIPFALRLEGALDVAALQGAFTRLVERHEVLRTTFEDREGLPAQRIHPPSPLPLPTIDVRDAAPDAIDARVRGLLAEEAGRPFDLARGPLLRTALLSLAPERHVLSVNLHH